MLVLTAAIIFQAARTLIYETLAKAADQTAHSGDQVNDWLTAQEDYINAFAIDLAHKDELTQESLLAQTGEHVAANEQFFDVYAGLPTGEVFFPRASCPTTIRAGAP